MGTTRDFLGLIWDGLPGHVTMVTRDEHGNLTDESWRPNTERGLSYLAKFADLHNEEDVYIGVAAFSDERRSKDDALATSRVVWADADTCHPDNFRTEPSVVVETSPGRWHCWWVLEEPVPASEAEQVARAIAYAHQGDGCDLGWTRTKLLRVPGTTNAKDAENPHPVQVTTATGELHTLDALRALYPAEAAPKQAASAPLPADATARELPADLKGRELWNVVAEDRSTRIWREINDLLRLGWTAPEVFATVRENSASARNKGYPDASLWTQVQDAAGTPKPEAPKRTSNIRLTKASAITPKLVLWAWAGRVPLGALTLLAGSEGLGKSTLIYDIAAKVTKGSLQGEFYGVPRSVLVAATEDSWEHTIIPRLMAAGADLDRVFQVDTETHDGLSFPRDNEELAAIAEATDAALLILDPITSRLGAKDSHKDAEVRQALEPVVAVAHKASMAVVGIIHLNKRSDSTRVLDRIMASKAFTALARSVLTVSENPDETITQDWPLVLTHAKCNLGPLARATALRVVGRPVRVLDPRNQQMVSSDVGAIKWGGELDLTATEAFRPADPDRKPGASETAKTFLREHLAANGGKARATQVREAASDVSIKKSSLDRAREALGVVVAWEGRESIWTLGA